jgi:hypothetical protein
LKTTWGSFETFWIPDEYQLSNVWRRIRDFAAWLRSGIACKIHYGAGLLDCHAVKYKGRHPQCPQNGRFVDVSKQDEKLVLPTNFLVLDAVYKILVMMI